MGKLSNIFGILALLLAGAAAYFSFVLAERRTEFRLRADKTATALAEIVKAVDDDSGTFLSSNISFSPGDPQAGTKESGSLGWQSFQDAKDDSGAYAAFQNLLTQAVNHVKALGRQRNELAEALVDVSVTLALPEDQVVVADLRNLADAGTFSRGTETIRSHAVAVAERDKAVIDALVEASRSIDQPIREAALTTREQTRDSDGQPALGSFTHRNELGTFTRNVRDLNERARSYAQTLSEAVDTIGTHDGVFRWSVDRNRLRDRTAYAGALTQMANDFRRINEELGNFVLAKQEVTQLSSKVESLEGDLDQAQRELTTTQDRLAKAAQRIVQLEQLAGVESSGGIPGLESDGAPAMLEGRVLSVDTNYNYVILDLGARDVEDNTELLIARDDKLIAKVRVAKVLNRFSVADILPSAMLGTVQVDDRVIPSAMQ